MIVTINLLVTFSLIANVLPSSVIRVGALFPTLHAEQNDPELSFQYAVHKINMDKSLLPDTHLVHRIKYINQDSFQTVKKVCNLVQGGVQAIFSSSDCALATHINSICDDLDIPDIGIGRSKQDFSINIHPSQKDVNRAFIDVIQYLNWTKFGILYEKDHGIISLNQISSSIQAEMHVRQVSPTLYLPVLREFKNKEIHNILIDVNSDFIPTLLKNILQQQMNEYKYHYFFTSFDLETFDLEDFKYNFVNITSFRLVDMSDVSVKEILKDMESYDRQTINRNRSTYSLKKAISIQTETALMFDSVYVFAIGLQSIYPLIHLSNLTCEDEVPWNGGLSLINFINAVEWKGLTGPIQFKEGQRVQFKLDLIKLKQHSIVKVGEWTPQTLLNITKPTLFFDAGSMNVTLVVITILESPYVMMHYEKNYTGNERFYGFCVDILETISHEVGFDYILDLVPDRKYGAKDPETGQWNGMVAQLMKYKADLAVGSMTITYARESVIDFTKPFMNLGISILFKLPSSEPTRLFSFMNPLAIEIWIYVLAAYFLVSLTIYVVANLSPIEWQAVHSCNLDHTTAAKNQFSISDSFWFSIGTLMQQSTDIYPKALSTRIISSIWGFFSLIIVASYTANLAAFLTVERLTNPIENAEDLASQTEISYGTLESGSTMTFFRDSMIETYKKMWRIMDNKKPSAFTTTYEDGIRRVNQGNYAFLMESTMLDYIVQRDCNLTQIGGLLDTKGYGIATPKGSPWRDKISLAILELQEKGDIQMLYDKWWKNIDETCIRKRNTKNPKANALGLDSIGGVFVVLIAGISVAFVVAFLEFLISFRGQSKPMQANDSNCRDYNSSNIVVHTHNTKADISYLSPSPSLCFEIFQELRFALWCTNKRQRPDIKRYCNECQL